MGVNHAQLRKTFDQGLELYHKTAEMMQAVLIARLKHIGEQDAYAFPFFLLELLDIQDNTLYESIRQAIAQSNEGTPVNVRVNEKLTLYFSGIGCREITPDFETLYTIGICREHLMVQINLPEPFAFISTAQELHREGATLFGLFGHHEITRRLEEYLLAFHEKMDINHPPCFTGPLSQDTYRHLLPETLRPLTELEQKVLTALHLEPAHH